MTLALGRIFDRTPKLIAIKEEKMTYWILLQLFIKSYHEESGRYIHLFYAYKCICIFRIYNKHLQRLSNSQMDKKYNQ